MLNSLGISAVPSNDSAPIRVFGDNFSVIQNASDPDATLKKKYVAISFHVVHEAITTGGSIAPFWLN